MNCASSPDGGVRLRVAAATTPPLTAAQPNPHLQFISSPFNFSSRCTFLSISISNHRSRSRSGSPLCNSTISSSSSSSSSGNYDRRPSKFSRRRRNINNQNYLEKELGYEQEEFEDSETANNGSLLAVNNKFQSPSAREKEIVELFRKVQAQLRERAAIKEERRVEESSSQESKGKETDTVDSLLKLLRKHSVQPGKKSSGKKDIAPVDAMPARPKSSFSRRSPVPVVKLQRVYPQQIDFHERNSEEDEDDYEEEEPRLVEGSDLSGMKTTELRALAKSLGMKGFSKLKKNELVELLSGRV
ncbi:rho-N domain-containing protein 1, chloroplastic-like [Andrographis paniculata]|uniref:rho-N domain-containing protein 1, chloroplastic-like n=1 Tax=Andrographis paniculata TaxID=175694 RepID=UPI0021E8520E|nr:rho-N domain-containing protein 1, chloroplastic-like [Andrographis paniculata]XP_051142140.1 rho-N domain-containing protein 1, chloroplastic-like [Andrographis paniculata]XP_051142141.1 rho-N domain-containing protein 1, chloroplastic-like [Andrographis paniculata]